MRWKSDREVEYRLLKLLVGVVVIAAAVAALIEWNGRRHAEVTAAPPPAPAATATATPPPLPAPVAQRTPSTLPTEAEEAASQAAWRAAREQTLRVQKQLREQEAARRAPPDPKANERCIDGQRFKRLDNGWAQVGTC